MENNVTKAKENTFNSIECFINDFGYLSYSQYKNELINLGAVSSNFGIDIFVCEVSSPEDVTLIGFYNGREIDSYRQVLPIKDLPDNYLVKLDKYIRFLYTKKQEERVFKQCKVVEDMMNEILNQQTEIVSDFLTLYGSNEYTFRGLNISILNVDREKCSVNVKIKQDAYGHKFLKINGSDFDKEIQVAILYKVVQEIEHLMEEE